MHVHLKPFKPDTFKPFLVGLRKEMAMSREQLHRACSTALHGRNNIGSIDGSKG